MENEADVIECLNSIGYTGDMLDSQKLHDAIMGGPRADDFRTLVCWIAKEIHVMMRLEEQVNPNTDINEFLMELSSFLKELMCPYLDFISGPLSDRFPTCESRILLLDYMTTELMALKMCRKLNQNQNELCSDIVYESPAAAALKDITISLNMGKPPDNITAKSLFDKIASRLEEVLKKSEDIVTKTTGSKKIGKPLFAPPKPLSDEQWEKLRKLQEELDFEYDLRRQMLVTRLDVTIQSFQWSDKVKGKEDDIANSYSAKRRQLDSLRNGGSRTDLAALLAARDDLAVTEKTSSASVRKNTNAKILKHVIGQVPDRGGRPYESAPPPPEMPSWQTNRSSGPGGRGGGGRGGRGGGGNRGGYNSQSNWHNNGGYHQNNYQSTGGGGGFYQHPQGQGYSQQNIPGGGGGGYQQRQQFDNRSGSHSRVQGGWSQKGSNNRVDYNDSRPSSRGGESSSSSRNDFYSPDQRSSGSGGSEYYNNRSGNGNNAAPYQTLYQGQNTVGGGGGNGGGGYRSGNQGNNNMNYNSRGGGGRGRNNYHRGGRRGH